MAKYAQILPGTEKVHWIGEYAQAPNFHADAGQFINIDGVNPEPKEGWDYISGQFLSPMFSWAVIDGSNHVSEIINMRELDAWDEIDNNGAVMVNLEGFEGSPTQPEVGWVYDPVTFDLSPPVVE